MARRVKMPWDAVRTGVFPGLLLIVWISAPSLWGASQKPNSTDRPQVPFGFTGLNTIQTGAYDSKGQPAAEVLQALNAMTLRGWEVIRRYYPQFGVISDSGGVSVNPRDPQDQRFYANFATEDPGRSPIPLISMICSLEPGDASGRLQALRAELLEAIRTEDYSTWPMERLRESVREMTLPQTTEKGVKYRAPKKTLTFRETVQLYAMMVMLLQKDDKWAKWQEEVRKLGYTAPVMPDVQDFSKRIQHQLPVIIPPGATRGMLLYRPGWDIAQPVTKEEYEERADAVLIKRVGKTFEVEQFPVYFTNDQKEWNPDWISPQDEVRDTTLTARKFEQQWTRFDGPYMWWKRDQLNGDELYRATVKFQKDDIVIEAERFVQRRGGVVRMARDPDYDPLNMKRFVAGMEMPEAPLTVEPPEIDDWRSAWRLMAKNINETCYRADDRELLWYKTGENSWSGSIFPRNDAGPAVMRPVQPVNTPSGGIVARFSGIGAEQPSDVQLLTNEEQTSVGIAVGLMNLCLANASGPDVNALRIALPRDKDNFTPVFFYSVRNGTSVQKSPQSLVVVLSEGYYNNYLSAFNRLLWVLEKPFAGDVERVAAIHRVMGEYLRTGLPKHAGQSNEAALIAWSQISQNNEVEQLFSASIVPGAVKTAAASEGGTAAKTVDAQAAPSGEWLRMTKAGEDPGTSRLDGMQAKNSETAVGLMNLYLAKSGDATAEQWRRWYPPGTVIAFRVAGNEQGIAKEEIRETTTSQGEKRTEASVTVELPLRAYADDALTLLWMLGVLEVNARGRDRSAAGLTGGQGTGVAGVLGFLRGLDPLQDPATSRALARLGVNAKTLSVSLPDVPAMFLSASPGDGAEQARGDARASGGRPMIEAEFPSDLGIGALSAAEQTMMSEVVKVMNLYLNKREEKKDRGAEQLRQSLAPVTHLHAYRNANEAIHVKPKENSELFVGLATQEVTYAGIFVEVLRVLEMQDQRLTKSWERRQDIASSIRTFLGSYAKENPNDAMAAELSKVEIKTMTELW